MITIRNQIGSGRSRNTKPPACMACRGLRIILEAGLSARSGVCGCSASLAWQVTCRNRRRGQPCRSRSCCCSSDSGGGSSVPGGSALCSTSAGSSGADGSSAPGGSALCSSAACSNDCNHCRSRSWGPWLRRWGQRRRKSGRRSSGRPSCSYCNHCCSSGAGGSSDPDGTAGGSIVPGSSADGGSHCRSRRPGRRRSRKSFRRRTCRQR